MTASSNIFALCVVGLTFVAGAAYCRTWKRLLGLEVTPSGFGVLLSIVVLGAAVVGNVQVKLLASFIIILLASFVYWLDDFIELSARLRILISFVSGMLFSSALVAWDDSNSLLLVLGAVGFINVALTNIVNFYDGADLNLATFIMLTEVITLFFSPMHSEWVPIAVACLAFTISFAVMNSRPKTIYFGDSGSFVFASVLSVMAVSFFKDVQSIPPEAAIPVALPAFDVFFVLLIRIKEKHNLLTRNYLHLYQRLNRRYQGFGYLLPQVINVALCLVFAAVLQAVGFGRFFSVTLAMILVTIPFYFSCKRLFIDNEAFDDSSRGHLL